MLPLFLLIFGISQQELITFMLEEIKVVFENLGYLNQLVIAGGGDERQMKLGIINCVLLCIEGLGRLHQTLIGGAEIL